jgi:hypothetical protein
VLPERLNYLETWLRLLGGEGEIVLVVPQGGDEVAPALVAACRNVWSLNPTGVSMVDGGGFSVQGQRTLSAREVVLLETIKDADDIFWAARSRDFKPHPRRGWDDVVVAAVHNDDSHWYADEVSIGNMYLRLDTYPSPEMSKVLAPDGLEIQMAVRREIWQRVEL